MNLCFVENILKGATTNESKLTALWWSFLLVV